jgi:hypothetical protein
MNRVVLSAADSGYVPSAKVTVRRSIKVLESYDCHSATFPTVQGVQQPTNHNLRPWIDWLLM